MTADISRKGIYQKDSRRFRLGKRAGQPGADSLTRWAAAEMKPQYCCVPDPMPLPLSAGFFPSCCFHHWTLGVAALITIPEEDSLTLLGLPASLALDPKPGVPTSDWPTWLSILQHQEKLGKYLVVFTSPSWGFSKIEKRVQKLDSQNPTEICNKHVSIMRFLSDSINNSWLR